MRFNAPRITLQERSPAWRMFRVAKGIARRAALSARPDSMETQAIAAAKRMRRRARAGGSSS